MNDIQYTYICHKQISNHESFISKQNKVKLYTVELAHSTKNSFDYCTIRKDLEKGSFIEYLQIEILHETTFNISIH